MTIDYAGQISEKQITGVRGEQGSAGSEARRDETKMRGNEWTQGWLRHVHTGEVQEKMQIALTGH